MFIEVAGVAAHRDGRGSEQERGGDKIIKIKIDALAE